MIDTLVAQWNANKGALEEWLRGSHPDSYEHLVRELVGRVLTEPTGEGWRHGRIDASRIHVIDDGDYQGTQIFVLALEGYQPNEDQYLWFANGYGSCSGCDTLEAIRKYSSEPPADDQVRDYMSLALHMVQRMKWLAPRGDENGTET